MSEQKGGRPEHQPTEKDRLQVKMLSAMGIGIDDISRVIGVSAPTLRKHYEREVELGHIEANAKVAGSLFRQATDPTKPNVTAAIFWLKVRAGWREADRDGEAFTPKAPREEPPGKKALAEANAVTAAIGTDWEQLLKTGSPPLQ